jgi:hypothetical protein
MVRPLAKRLYPRDITMLKFITSSDAAHGASVALVVVTAALVGQYAARGINPTQWVFGLTAIAGSIAVAVMLRCWPAPRQDSVAARD